MRRAARYKGRLPARKSPPIHLSLVDDDVFNREGLRLYLTREGFTIHEATDVYPAVAIVDIGIPLDAATPSLPGQPGGLTLTRNLKRGYPAMGIVLFSAHEDRGADVLQLIQSGHRGLGYKLKGSQPAALQRATQQADAQTEHLHAQAAAIEDLLSAGALSPNADADIEAQLATLKRQ